MKRTVFTRFLVIAALLLFVGVAAAANPAQLRGLSTDTKPTNVAPGSTFYETNTTNTYVYRQYPDGTRAWVNQTTGSATTYYLATLSADGSTAITATANEINIMDGVTATTAEINKLAGVTGGTATAGKAAVLGTNKELNEFHTAALYLGAGAGTQVTSSAAELNILDGVTATAAELNILDGAPATATLAKAAGGANVSEITVTVKDAAGNAIAETFNFDIWLSDDAGGQGLTSTTASGAVEPKAASGTSLKVYTAKKALRVQSLKTGVFVLSITDSAKTAFKVCVQVPGTGRTVVTTLAGTDYGS